MRTPPKPKLIAPFAEPHIDLHLPNGFSAYKFEPVTWRDLQMPSRINQKLPNGRTTLIHHADHDGKGPGWGPFHVCIYLNSSFMIPLMVRSSPALSVSSTPTHSAFSLVTKAATTFPEFGSTTCPSMT